MIYDLQKASILKRISAWLLDFICICIIAVGVAAFISWVSDFDGHYQDFYAYLEEYGQEYGVDLTKDIPQDASEEYKTNYAQANAALAKDKDAMKVYSLITSLAFTMVSIGLLVAFLIVEFVLPLILKNGQTVGKKVFQVGVMQISGTKIGPFALFVRAVLGKYTIETMVPVLLFCMIIMGQGSIIILLVVAAIGVAQIALVITTKTNSLIHDILSSTVTVDMATQMIFDTKEQLIKYKEDLHLAEVEKAKENYNKSEGSNE